MGRAEPINQSETKIFKSGGGELLAEVELAVGWFTGRERAVRGDNKWTESDRLIDTRGQKQTD